MKNNNDITKRSQLSPEHLNALNFAQLKSENPVTVVQQQYNSAVTRTENTPLDESARNLEQFKEHNSRGILYLCHEKDNRKIAVTSAAIDFEQATTARETRKSGGTILLGKLAKELKNISNGLTDIIIPLAEGKGLRNHWVTLHITLDNNQKIASATLYDSKSRFANTRYSKKPIIEMLKAFDSDFGTAGHPSLTSVFTGQQSFFNNYDCGLWSHTYTNELVNSGSINLKHKPKLNSLALRNSLITFYELSTERLVSFLERFKQIFGLNKKPTQANGRSMASESEGSANQSSTGRMVTDLGGNSVEGGAEDDDVISNFSMSDDNDEGWDRVPSTNSATVANSDGAKGTAVLPKTASTHAHEVHRRLT